MQLGQKFNEMLQVFVDILLYRKERKCGKEYCIYSAIVILQAVAVITQVLKTVKKLNPPFILLYYLNSNAERKHEKYYQLTRDLSSDCHSVKFINLSLSALGIFGKSCERFIDMCKELEFDKQHTDFIVRKLSTIIIRSTYYIFCMGNMLWTNPDLFFSFFFILILSSASYLIVARCVFVFLNIISLSEVLKKLCREFLITDFMLVFAKSKRHSSYTAKSSNY